MDTKKFLEVFRQITMIYESNEESKENRQLLIQLELEIERILEEVT